MCVIWVISSLFPVFLLLLFRMVIMSENEFEAREMNFPITLNTSKSKNSLCLP